jgi:hypothetical protein
VYVWKAPGRGHRWDCGHAFVIIINIIMLPIVL